MASAGLKDELFQLKLARKIDSRTTACSVRAEHNGKAVRVSGFSHFPQTDRFVRKVAAEVYGADNVDFALKILTKAPLRFGQVVPASASFWKQESMADPDEMQTQALCGAVLRLFFKSGKYWFAQHPDGYVGYVEAKHLAPVDKAYYLRWKNGAHAITKVPLHNGALPAGSRLIMDGGKILLPNGDRLEVSAKDCLVRDPSASKFYSKVEKSVLAYEGTKYLWGGKTESGIDCSGLMQSLALQQNILLPRDASMQAHVGEFVGHLPDYEDLLPGDLMFFMNDQAHVFHVGMFAGNETYLHSSGKLGVDRSSIVSTGTNFMDRYATSYVFGRRIQ